MHRRLLSYLASPETGSPLSLIEDVVDGDIIVSGKLVAEAGKTYPIIGGIPRFIPGHESLSKEVKNTVERFGKQWNQFDFMGEHYRDQFLGWIAPNTPKTFKDKIVVEGGCGKGRHAKLVSEFGAKEVIAVDLSDAVHAAYRNTKHLNNVHVIQADLHQLPLKKEIADIVFSVGVLHHTPEPEVCFHALSSVLKQNGKMIVWVYGFENNEWIISGINPVREAVTSRLSHQAVYELSKFPAAILWLATKGIYKPAFQMGLTKIQKKLFYSTYLSSISDFPFKEIHSIVHDHLAPPIAHYLKKEEVEAWFQSGPFRDIQISWHNENSWRGTAIKCSMDEKKYSFSLVS